MDEYLLVPTHISSLFPSSRIASIPIQTSRRNTPLPPAPKESDPPVEHALYSTTLHSQNTGTILLRVIHGGLILELIPLSSLEKFPIRFVFPAAVISSPGIFIWEASELHIIAVTITGSLYRLVLPLGDGRQLWTDTVGRNWCREYLIKSTPGDLEGIVQVQGTHCVAIGLPNGYLLRLEAEILGNDSYNDQWTETMFQNNSFFTSLTSFLPSLHTGPNNGIEIISMASHPQPTDIGCIWTLSRDRTLRLWTAKSGCVVAKTLSALSGRGSTPSPGTSSTSKPHTLLDAERQTLIRVFSTSSEEHPLLLAFTPTPSSSAGGFFQIFRASTDHLEEVGTVECSRSSAHSHLQDFIIHNSALYTLWDRQGQSAVEKTSLNSDGFAEWNSSKLWTWQVVTYAQESELTPAYLDELLLSPGSLTDKFFEAIMRPGTFSSLTLRTAIDQYADACLSLPGLPPPQLMTPYATLGENIAAVVGCTVNLMRDPQTGALQYDNYWNALKRDWEGFIARCREVERSARWPLALGVEDSTNRVFVLERERIASLAREDLPLKFHRRLSSAFPLDPQFSLLDIVWTLRSKIEHRLMLNIENHMVEIMHQETAFSFADIIQDQARRSRFREELDQGLESWIEGRLASVGDLDQPTRTILDIVAGYDPEVKREEEDVGLLIPSTSSQWSRSLTAAYISKSVHARYDLCVSLITLLFFVSEDLRHWDPSLLAEVFAVFRGIAMLRFVAQQPAGDVNDRDMSVSGGPSTTDDVIAHLSNMQVSQNRSRFTLTYSTIHRLLNQSSDVQDLPTAAHRFLDSTGLLQSTSPAHATKFEVLFCERLRLAGYYDVARELLAWLPRTAGVTYILGRLWLNVGRADDAVYLLEKLAGCFAINSALSYEDQEALASVLPSAELFDSDFSFYLHAASLFKSGLLVSHDVYFSQLALSVAPPGTDTTSLWLVIINGYISLGLFDDAYATLIATPNDKIKRECVGQLVYRMCEDSAIEKLMSFNFAGFSDEVEDALSFKARNTDPRIRPYYSKVLYTWYTLRSDHRNAALTIYQRARKIHDLITDPITFAELAEQELEAYMVSMNSLSLLDGKNTWIVIPVPHESVYEPRKRRKLSRHIPEAKYAAGKQDTEIIELADMQYEYAILSARVDLIRKDPTLLSSGEFMLPPSSIILRLAQSNRFNTAMSTARSLNIDMTDLFAHLTSQCLRLVRNPDVVIQEDTSDWLLTDRVSSWPGTPADRGWRYLRQALERHDNVETDFRYSKATLETILTFDRVSSPPPWLVRLLEKHHHEYLVRVSLRYEVVEAAIEHTLSLIRETDARLAREPPRNASSTWLPYTLIDQVLVAAASHVDLSSRGQTLRQELQTEVANHVKRMHKFSQFSSR